MYSRNRNYFIPIEGIGYVNNDSASALLCTIPEYDPDMFFYLEKLNFSVSKAAVGGSGICEIQDHRGNIIWSINVDVVKDLSLDFGEDGVKVDEHPVGSLLVALSGADTQATVSVSVLGHLDRV